MKQNIKEKLSQLREINWDFPDYRGISSIPADINAIHWYPSPFVPQIPFILIRTFTEKGDTVLDPFAGSGVALVESARLKRNFIGVDINPYAVNIMKAKFYALSLVDQEYFLKIKEDITSLLSTMNELSIEDYIMKSGINNEVFKWFEKKTLNELCLLHKYIKTEPDPRSELIKRVLFSSILPKCCSQRRHYTYVTDGCYPEKLVYINAIKLFLNQAELTASAAERFRKEYKRLHGEKLSYVNCKIFRGDARNLKFLDDCSVDMVITSPTYLGVNDCVRSMRLTWLFFPEEGIEDAMKNEIGARWKRNRKNAYEEYISDLNKAFSEISRVLKPTGFFCLVIGQGRGRVNKGHDIVKEILQIVTKRYGFKIKGIFSRRINFRRISIYRDANESIVILNRA